VVLLAFSGAGCKKKPTPPPPPPPPPSPTKEAPPPPPRPTVSLSAKPSTIERGQSTTLAWESQDATALTLEPGLGQVPARGSMTVSPYESTTYRLAVKGPGGTAEASARVTVNPPPRPPAPPTKPVEEDIQTSFNSRVRDIYFDYDKSNIRPDAVPVLQANGEWLRAHAKANIVIEGHCDERGSAEYNLGLGDRRATAAKEYLVTLGIDGNRIRTISYGKEKPVCTEHNEDCWQRCRHGHFVLAQ
jgi:peptidoglycan-associated lipoprotein